MNRDVTGIANTAAHSVDNAQLTKAVDTATLEELREAFAVVRASAQPPQTIIERFFPSGAQKARSAGEAELVRVALTQQVAALEAVGNARLVHVTKVLSEWLLLAEEARNSAVSAAVARAISSTGELVRNTCLRIASSTGPMLRAAENLEPELREPVYQSLMTSIRNDLQMLEEVKGSLNQQLRAAVG
jgi:hypothetical protein